MSYQIEEAERRLSAAIQAKENVARKTDQAVQEAEKLIYLAQQHDETATQMEQELIGLDIETARYADNEAAAQVDMKNAIALLQEAQLAVAETRKRHEEAANQAKQIGERLLRSKKVVNVERQRGELCLCKADCIMTAVRTLSAKADEDVANAKHDLVDKKIAAEEAQGEPEDNKDIDGAEPVKLAVVGGYR